MRAVTLSDPETNRMINENFVVTWFNQAPEVFPPDTGSRQPPVDETYLANFPDGARFVLHEQVAEADKVMTRWTLESGDETKASGMTLIRLADGKLAEEWEYFG